MPPHADGPPDDAPLPGAEFIAPGGKLDPARLRRPAEGDPDLAQTEGDDDAPSRVVFRLQRDLQKRLDKYLTDRIPFMSRTQLQRLIDEGGVTVNARKPKASTVLRRGDEVEVFVPPPPPTEIQPEAIPLTVLYEDAYLIVLDKQADILVHPARSHLSGTLLNALAHHFRQGRSGGLSGVGKDLARPGVVHRLDRNTTGVIVFAKDDEAHWRLGRQFEVRTVDKRYLALVHGWFEPLVEVIDLPIGPHPSKEKGYREKFVVRHDDLGKPSVTIARVLERFGEGPGDESAGTLLELELKTGRTHQIRVHLSHLGFPIVGDEMYGGRSLVRQGAPSLPRQALHAALLGFRHPIGGGALEFRSPVPEDIRRVVVYLRRTCRSDRHAPPGARLGAGDAAPEEAH